MSCEIFCRWRAGAENTKDWRGTNVSLEPLCPGEKKENAPRCMDGGIAVAEFWWWGDSRSCFTSSRCDPRYRQWKWREINVITAPFTSHAATVSKPSSYRPQEYSSKTKAFGRWLHLQKILDLQTQVVQINRTPSCFSTQAGGISLLETIHFSQRVLLGIIRNQMVS